jgi:hypothetical protein
MLVPAVAASAELVAAGVMALTATRFAITGVYEITGSSVWKTTSGLVGLVLAAAAYYAAFGFEIEDAKGRTVLPLLRPRSCAHLAARRRGRPARRRRARGGRPRAAVGAARQVLEPGHVPGAGTAGSWRALTCA